jgi:SPP1 family predicted phage head-tail adaptor
MSINPGGVAGHPFPYSQTVTLLRRVLAGQNEYGNDTYTDVPVQIPYCVVQPGSSSENVQWTEQVSTEVTVFVPYGTQVTALDAFLIGGVKYEVQGVPSEWRSPFSGHTSPTQVRAAVVTGASV